MVLNGPRHFLMDSVTASPGRVRSFHGQRLRRVAQIPIHTAADLARTPYTDRTVARGNTWRWKAGRRVYELVAPGGDIYVMQAYSQIVDRTQKIGDLRTLGRRLDLPPGWRYRTRVLRRPLAVGAPGGKATITQDELQNTYQLARTTRAPGRRKRHRVSLDAKTKSVTTTQPGTIEDRGSIRGTPFGRGTVTLNVVLGAGRGDRHGPAALPERIDHRQLRHGLLDQRRRDRLQGQPPVSPRAPARTEGSRAARWPPTTTTRSTGRMGSCRSTGSPGTSGRWTSPT